MWLVLLTLTSTAQVLGALYTRAPVTMVGFNTDKENARIANKSLEFVKNIRADLRRNNDDYVAERERQKQLLSRMTSVPPTRVPPTRVPPTRIPPTRVPPTRIPPKRGPPEQEPHKRQQLKVTLDTRRSLNVTQNRTTVGVASKTTTHARLQVNLFRTYTQPQKQHFKKIRIDRLKRLIDKGKSRLRELTQASETTLAGVKGAEGAARADGAARAEGAAKAEVGERQGAEAALTPAPAEGAAAAVGAEGAGEYDGTEAAQGPPAPATPRRPPAPAPHAGVMRQREAPYVPSAHQLDMAPARGPRIHAMRLKRRLCQRNLLFPEGPMYDKQGHTAMPKRESALKYGWVYLATTHKPDFLLPRCCNCCKKSVLGCE